jgi:hypothetical protein
LFDSKGFSTFFLSGEGHGVKAESEKAKKRESGNGGMREGKGFDTNCTNFHEFLNNRWTRIEKRKAKSGKAETAEPIGITADFCNSLRQLQMDTDKSPNAACAATTGFSSL